MAERAYPEHPPKKKVDYAQVLSDQLVAAGLPRPEREVRFCGRGWRFDLAWTDLHVSLEVEGGAFIGGRHTRGIGYEGDCEKYNTAQDLDWQVLRFTTGMVRRREAVHFILHYFERHWPTLAGAIFWPEPPTPRRRRRKIRKEPIP